MNMKKKGRRERKAEKSNEGMKWKSVGTEVLPNHLAEVEER